MLRIRLARGGRKKRPFYKIVVMESSSARDSKAVDIIGHYDPLIKEGKKFVLNVEKYQHWHSHGAQPSERVEKLYNLEING